MKYWKDCTICQGTGTVEDESGPIAICSVSPPEDEKGHQWFFFKEDNFRCCMKCGNVERRDKKNSPCKGPVRIELRLPARPEGEKK